MQSLSVDEQKTEIAEMMTGISEALAKLTEVFRHDRGVLAVAHRLAADAQEWCGRTPVEIARERVFAGLSELRRIANHPDPVSYVRVQPINSGVTMRPQQLWGRPFQAPATPEQLAERARAEGERQAAEAKRARENAARDFLTHLTARGLRVTHHAGKISIFPRWKLVAEDVAKVRDLHSEILEALNDVAVF